MELVVALGRGGAGGLIAGEVEAEALEEILAAFEESLEPLPSPCGCWPSCIEWCMADTGEGILEA